MKPSYIGVYCPTLGRPHTLKRFADNVRETTTCRYRIVFAVEPGDDESLESARATGHRVVVNRDRPSYSNSLQACFDSDDSEWFIAANDDFDFQPDWDAAALDVMRQPGVRVVGIDDGITNCQFTTICLVERGYILEQSGVVDIPGRVQFPYLHNYVDTEFHLTAAARGVFAVAHQSRIVHRHPDWGMGNMDATYAKSQETLAADRMLFESRRGLFG